MELVVCVFYHIRCWDLHCHSWSAHWPLGVS